MFRAILFSLSLVIVACSPQSNQVSLCGEPIEKVGDQGAFSATIDHPELPGVFVKSERGKVSVGIFQTGTCEPYLQLGDSDSDGVFDLLTYSALSQDGELLVDVEDYGMDGQPEFILNHSNSTASVFYQGSWYTVEGIGPNGEKPSVSIKGQRRLLADVLEEIGRRPF